MDYSDYADTPSEEVFAELARLVHDLKDAGRQVATAEAALDTAKKRYRQLSETLLPEKMEELGLSEFKHTSGLKLKLKEVFSVGLPKKDIERYARGLSWLEEQGHGKLIKRKLQAQFKKGQADAAKALAKELQQQGYPVKVDKEIHPSTLKAFIKERLEAGEYVPDEIFGIHRGKIAEVK